MSEHPLLTALAILEVVYVVSMAGWIVLQKRAPLATVAWILALALLPVVGFFVYLFLGPRRIAKSRLKRLRAKQAIARFQRHEYGSVLQEQVSRTLARQIARIGERISQAPVSVATACTLYTDGDENLDAIVLAIDSATHHVHVQYYIFEPDKTGTRIRDALVRAASRGVAVRVLLDAVGSSAITKAFSSPLTDAGGHASFFNRPGLVRRMRRVNFRNHRKIVVCDGRIGFLGGMNVHDEESPRARKDFWRDTHLRLEGPAVAWLQLVFLEDWHYTRGYGPRDPELFPEHHGLEGTLYPVQIVDSGPDTEYEAIMLSLFSAISAARSRVWITTAYFVPDESMQSALKAAALRGVDVRLLLSERSDSRLVSAASRSYYEELLRCRVRIYEYRPRMLHAKTMVVDDWFSSVGTANMDNRSFRLNFEVIAILYGSTISEKLAEIFERDLEQARPIFLSMGHRAPFLTRLEETTARILAPLL